MLRSAPAAGATSTGLRSSFAAKWLFLRLRMKLAVYRNPFGFLGWGFSLGVELPSPFELSPKGPIKAKPMPIGRSPTGIDCIRSGTEVCAPAAAAKSSAAHTVGRNRRENLNIFIIGNSLSKNAFSSLVDVPNDSAPDGNPSFYRLER